MPAERTDEDIAQIIARRYGPRSPTIRACIKQDVMDALRAARAEGEAAEREACAMLVEAFKGSDALRSTAPDTAAQINRVSLVRREARFIATAIRARSAPREGDTNGTA